jgi:hypothetical protein
VLLRARGSSNSRAFAGWLLSIKPSAVLKNEVGFAPAFPPAAPPRDNDGRTALITSESPSQGASRTPCSNSSMPSIALAGRNPSKVLPPASAETL